MELRNSCTWSRVDPGSVTTQSPLALQGPGLVFPVQQRIEADLETEKPL